MPMKCIDQMPIPIDRAPPSSHSSHVRPAVVATLPATPSVAYAATMATTTDRKTSQEEYDPATMISTDKNAVPGLPYRPMYTCVVAPHARSGLQRRCDAVGRAPVLPPGSGRGVRGVKPELPTLGERCRRIT